MNKFSEKSLSKLKTCDTRIQMIMNEVLQIVDITILEGKRTKEKQNGYYEAGKSKLKYPDSKHNKEPSMAVDIAVWHKKEPHIQWKNINEWYYLAGIIKGMAHKLGIQLRAGCDWDSDNDFTDQTFNDYPHFEING